MPTVWKRSDKNELTTTVKQICNIQSHILCTLCLTNRASRGSPDFTSFCTKSFLYDRGLFDDYVYC